MEWRGGEVKGGDSNHEFFSIFFVDLILWA